MFTNKCGIVNTNLKTYYNIFLNVYLLCSFFDPHLTTHQSNISCMVYIATEYHPYTLPLLIKACGCYLVCFPCSPTSTDYSYTTKLVLYW